VRVRGMPGEYVTLGIVMGPRGPHELLLASSADVGELEWVAQLGDRKVRVDRSATRDPGSRAPMPRGAPIRCGLCRGGTGSFPRGSSVRQLGDRDRSPAGGC